MIFAPSELIFMDNFYFNGGIFLNENSVPYIYAKNLYRINWNVTKVSKNA